jgi:serine protease Do
MRERKQIQPAMGPNGNKVAAWAAVILLLLTGGSGETAAKLSPTNGPADLSKSTEELSSRVSQAVVQVFASGFRLTSEDESNPGLVRRVRSGGSGVILDPAGYIVTNAHVVEGAARVEMKALPASPS